MTQKVKVGGQRTLDSSVHADPQPAELSPNLGTKFTERAGALRSLIKGRVPFDNSVLDDLSILRSNGYPTYHCSVVVDDALMGMTHVIRGDDHLTNTPRQIPIVPALETARGDLSPGLSRDGISA